MPQVTYRRIDLAKEQLDVALELFISQRSFVSALTLAGGAEEILGKALFQHGKEKALRYEFSATAPVQELLRRRPYNWNDFNREKDRVRNAAKHMDKASEPDVVADLEDEALWMIVRAYENYQRLGLDATPRMKEFGEWFWKNVVGAEDYV